MIISAGSAPPDDPVSHLRALSERLRADGWRAELVVPADESRAPCLRVINPVAVVLNDEITAAPTVPGLWWFWWSWGERFACAENIDLAAARVMTVLGVGDP